MKHSSSPRSGFSILKFLLGLVLLFIVAVAVFLTFFLSPTAKWAANSQLSKVLGTEASVETVSIKLWSGDVEIGGVKVADPTGTADEPKPELFSLGRFFVDIDMSSLFGDTLIVREVTIESPEFNTWRDKEGAFSFEKLAVLQPSTEEPEPVEEETAPESAPMGKAIRVDAITIKNLAGSFSDASDLKADKQYALKGLNFHSGPITVNQGNVVASLQDGIDIALIELSDGELSYQTNHNLPDPNATTEDAKKTSKEAQTEQKTAATDAESAKAEEPAADEESSTTRTDPVYLAKFSLSNFRIHYNDTPANQKEPPLDLVLTDIYANAEDISFDPDGLLQKSVDEILTGKMGFKIQQKVEGASPAVFTAVAKSTVLGSGLPVTAGSVQLTGFELATVKPLVPRGVESAIGGPGFDLFVKWFMAPDELEGTAKLTSSQNVVTNISVGGTPEKPVIKGGDLLMNVVGRPGQMLGNLTGNAFKGSMEIVSGATDAAGNLVKGAGQTVAGFGKGLLNTGKGLLKGDLKEAGKGLGEATVGTVKNATDTVGKTAESAVGGVGKAYDSTTGGARTADWRVSNQKRHAEFEKGAQAWLEDGTFPPPNSKAGDSAKPEEQPAADGTDATADGAESTQSSGAETSDSDEATTSEDPPER